MDDLSLDRNGIDLMNIIAALFEMVPQCEKNNYGYPIGWQGPKIQGDAKRSWTPAQTETPPIMSLQYCNAIGQTLAISHIWSQ